MKKNADGSLTLYIQKDSPGKDKESNWLPAPDGPIYLVMRLYWPKDTPPSILPPGEGTWQPPALVQAPVMSRRARRPRRTQLRATAGRRRNQKATHPARYDAIERMNASR